MDITEHFLKSTNNIITLALTEDGTGISSTWTDLDISICDPDSLVEQLNISRAANGDGIALTTDTGILTIDVGRLIEDLSTVFVGRLYRVFITVQDSLNPQGMRFGKGDTASRLFFRVG